ncbi:MAG: alpha/beta hydrolase [Hyphomicrobiales bacterium]|nr:alpha/beta hydrolase [Hyphomicrobiales bacterium]
MDLVGIARNPVPSGAVPGSFVARDGTVIRYALWPRTADKRLGTVCLFGGRGEFIEKYFETISDLRRRGFAVAMMDWRGQGGSERPLKNLKKGHVEDFHEFDHDLGQFMTEIVLPDCPAPFYGMAHSMGGHILLRSARTKVCWFDRIIMSAPMIDIYRELSVKPLQRLFIETLVLLGLGDFYIPGGRDTPSEYIPFEKNEVTSDQLRYDRINDVLRAAPQLGLGSPTLGWVQAAARSIAMLNSFGFASSVRIPVLIVAGGNETVVSMRAMESFAAQIKNCKLIVIAGAKHELLQERDTLRDQFWAAFDAYVPGSNRTMSESHIGF